MASPLDDTYDAAAQLLLMRRRNSSSIPPEPMPPIQGDPNQTQKLAALLKTQTK